MPQRTEARTEARFTSPHQILTRFPKAETGIVDVSALESIGKELLLFDARRSTILQEFTGAVIGLYGRPDFAKAILRGASEAQMIRLPSGRGVLAYSEQFLLQEYTFKYSLGIVYVGGDAPHFELVAHTDFMIPPQDKYRLNLKNRYTPPEKTIEDWLMDLQATSTYLFKKRTRTFYQKPPDYPVSSFMRREDERLIRSVLHAMDEDLFIRRFPLLMSDFRAGDSSFVNEYLALLPVHTIEAKRDSNDTPFYLRASIRRTLFPNDFQQYKEALTHPMVQRITGDFNDAFNTGTLDMRYDLQQNDWNFLVMIRTINALNNVASRKNP